MTSPIRLEGVKVVSAADIAPLNPDSQTIAQNVFIDSVDKLLNEAKKNHWCKDYLTDEVYKLTQNNLEVAESLKFPQDHLSIRKELVDSWLGNKEISCEEPIWEIVECVNKNKWTLFGSSLACGFSIAAFPTPANSISIAGLTLVCGSIIPNLVNCLPPHQN